MRKELIIIIFLALVIGVLYFGINGKVGLPFLSGLSLGNVVQNKVITINYWGLNNDKNMIQPIIEEYQKEHPNITINYSQESILNYRTRLQTQIRANQGPDIFEIHNSWVPIFTTDLAPAPDSVMTASDMASFYPIVSDSLLIGGRVYGLPLELDGLVMFYNEDLLAGANATIPSTWQQLVSVAQKTTVRNEQGQIQTAGVALGTTNNIEYWPDIVGLLFFQQPGGNLIQPSSSEGSEVLQFYKSFVADSKTKVWDQSLPSAKSMFQSGRLIFYIAPASLANEIKNSNPNLKFKAAPLPQIPNRQAGWGRFWIQGISKRSQNSYEAWAFLKYLSSEDSLKKINQYKSANNQQPMAYPRVEMASEQINDPVLGAVIVQGTYLKNWFLNSGTQDAGLNDEMVLNYQEILTSGTDSESKIVQTLAKYGLSAASSAR